MKFIRNIILLSFASFAFTSLNIKAFSFAGTTIGAWTGYTTPIQKKVTNIRQSMETLRADDKVEITLYGLVRGVGTDVDTIVINPKSDNGTYLKQSFSTDSQPTGDYRVRVRKVSVAGYTRYWGIWNYNH